MTGFDGSPSADAWPAGGLEPVVQCPVCGSESRTLLYEGLRDCIFFCAPGEWRLFRCTHCRSGYLDPRPTRETTHLAYRNYFTHDGDTPADTLAEGPFARVFRNGYRNWRYGTFDRPASRLGVFVKVLQPKRRAKIDAEMRHLPKSWPGATLLDVGCGNGRFLERAQDAGWRVAGLDPDRTAVDAARFRGLDVRVGGIEVFDGVKEQFDRITMSHVIEHVHDPTGLLRACHRLLRPGGGIWIETPNLDSIGHSIYGSSWRGLEPPRHLVLFTYESLRAALAQAGFQGIHDVPYRPVCAEIFSASEDISSRSRGSLPGVFAPLRHDQLRIAERKEGETPALREFVTLQAIASMN